MIRNIIIDANGYKIDLSGFSDVEIAAKTAWGECRGGGRDGMQSVLNVGVNRTKDDRWGDTLREVFLQKWQFSVWNDGINPNRDRTIAVDESEPDYLIALELAQQALDGVLEDITLGAVYYFAKGIATPSWAQGYSPCIEIANQEFFNAIPN